MAANRAGFVNPMKRPDNTEIDRLLRRHARPGGGAVPAGEGAGAHMDADEMNAYAEGALPDAARSRYFAHLADCGSCRKLVTQLTLAAVADAEGRERAAAATVAAAPSKSWRERLAAIFSPPVLRYAVPALALFAVVVVALVAMRANRGDSYVVREQAAPNAGPGILPNTSSAVQPEAKSEGGENHSTGNANASNVYDGQTVTQPPAASATPAAPATAERAPADKDGPAAGQARQPEETMARTDVAKAPSREGEAKMGDRRAQEEADAAPPPAPRPMKQQEPVLAAPPAADATSGRDKEEGQAKTAGKDDGNVVTTGGGVATETQPNKGRGELGRAAGAASTRTVARKRGSADESARNERAAETRHVSGRSFQRQGGAWVDTDYNSSRPTTNVRRGSEHYRTLVADEPGLRAIAEQLGGEVTVVWKDRAYHFY